MKKTTILLLVLALCFALGATKAFADTATGQVTLNNAAPSVGTVTLWNQAGVDAAITLTAGSTVTVTANVTVTDTNGGSDISSAAATLYHSTSTSAGADDENIHLTNGTCTVGTPSGNDAVATCQFTMNYMALGGTWTANITATDASAATGSGTDANTANDLAGLDVAEANVNFGAMDLSTNSSSAQATTVKNAGNVQIDSQFSGTTYSCTSGTIPVGNTRCSQSTGNYDSMSVDLTTSPATDAAFNLGVRGVATSNGADSTKSEYWTIKIPASGVGGSCSDTITIGAVAG